MVTNIKYFGGFMLTLELNNSHHVSLNLEQVSKFRDELLTLKDSWIDEKSQKFIFLNLPENHLQIDLILGNLFPVSPFLYADLCKFLGKKHFLKEKTIQSYSGFIKSFFLAYSVRFWEVSEKNIHEFMQSFIHKKNPANSTIHLMISALQFFFRDGLGVLPDLQISRPKKEKVYPDILNKEEIKKILQSTENPKHKALLGLVYSSGLRVSEVVNLKISDIDKERRVLKVASGDKNVRTTILSEMGVKIVENYVSQLENPHYLFPGQNLLKPISIRSAEKIFEAASKKAGIQKKVSIHSLRHAFAIHLLQEGLDVKHLQTLLGHKNLQTTQVYKSLATPEQELLKTGT